MRTPRVSSTPRRLSSRIPRRLSSRIQRRIPSRIPNRIPGRGQDGKVLLNCHAGCALGDIAAALGIRMAELFPDEQPRGMQVEATYEYRDERGALLFQVQRLAGKQFRQRKPATAGRLKLGDTRRVLYRLPEIVASADDEHVVYVCEGEKDADALARLGLVATSNPGDAGKWRPEYSASLRGREVVILAWQRRARPRACRPGRPGRSRTSPFASA